jgi:glycosyltransferase involved in cell wall biosynthesis
MNLSVLIPVYAQESPRFLGECLDSLAAQTRAADEVVIVEDGPLTEELDATIHYHARHLPVVRATLPRHAGLGEALRSGLEACRGVYVARMDADDIALPARFERQMSFLAAHPGIDVVGSAIAEFHDLPGAPHAIRRLPGSGIALRRFAALRNPLNHMTVLFRRQSVIAAGNYQPFAGFEDYHLWARMLQLGYRIHNLPDVLVLARCGAGMQARRGGLSYLVREASFQLFLHRAGLLSATACLRNLLIRAPIRIAPAFARAFFYSRVLRQPVPASRELNATGEFKIE